MPNKVAWSSLVTTPPISSSGTQRGNWHCHGTRLMSDTSFPSWGVYTFWLLALIRDWMVNRRTSRFPLSWNLWGRELGILVLRSPLTVYCNQYGNSDTLDLGKQSTLPLKTKKERHKAGLLAAKTTVILTGRDQIPICIFTAQFRENAMAIRTFICFHRDWLTGIFW